MDLDSFLRPWSGSAFRHTPQGSPFDVLDFRFAGLAANNRWNYRGEPTLYLAGDTGVALAEFARHIEVDRPRGVAPHTIARQLFRLQLSMDCLLDLRDNNLCDALSLKNAPHCFLDRGVSQTVSQFLRRTTKAQAILAPSVALLDQPDRWVMVLFLEKLPPDPKVFFTSVIPAGQFQVNL